MGESRTPRTLAHDYSRLSLMLITEIAKPAQIVCQSVSVATREIVAVESPVKRPNHCVHLPRLIHGLVPLPLKFAQLAADPVESITAVAECGQIILRSVKVGSYPRKEPLVVSEVADAIRSVRSLISSLRSGLRDVQRK